MYAGFDYSIYEPQLVSPAGQLLDDTLNWMSLCWVYRATGGERFMTIGMFESEATVTVTQVRPYS